MSEPHVLRTDARRTYFAIAERCDRSRAACLIPLCRATFGVLGANVPALIRGLIAVARYGIQTYLASTAFVIIVLKFWPSLAPYADVHRHGFVGLSALGWAGFMVL